MQKNKDDLKQAPDVAPSEGSESRDTLSPSHWQGEPLPKGDDDQTQDVGFDQRGAGRARQYGRAGAYGKHHNEQERRPTRGDVPPDDSLRDALVDAFDRSGVNLDAVIIAVNSGVVQLEGQVADRDEKYLLERLAAKISGIVSVKNRLEFGSSSPDNEVM